MLILLRVTLYAKSRGKRNGSYLVALGPAILAASHVLEEELDERDLGLGEVPAEERVEQAGAQVEHGQRRMPDQVHSGIAWLVCSFLRFF